MHGVSNDKRGYSTAPSKFEVFFAVFREKPEFYGENPIAKRFGMGFSQVTVHALDRACTVTTERFRRDYGVIKVGFALCKNREFCYNKCV